jgi:hypothetical protein
MWHNVLSMTWTVRRLNAIIGFVFVALVLFYFPAIHERLLPPMYDEKSSFSRVDPRPGWLDTGIVIHEGRPIGIIVSGTVSTPRLTHATPTNDHKLDQIGPAGSELKEELIYAWRELDEFPAFALVGRVDGGKPFLVGERAKIAIPGRLELKINCPLWDKSVLDEPGTVKKRRRSPLSSKELENLRSLRGFFAYRTWDLQSPPPRAPRLPLTASRITQMYGPPTSSDR